MHKYQHIVNKIRDIYHEPEAFIPLHAPVFKGNEKKYLNECIDTTFVSSVGKFVTQFEIEMAKYTGVKNAVACVNGTNALHLALLLVGVEKDTEVITQPLTFIATANAISYCNAQPIFLDVDIDTMGLSSLAFLHFLENKTTQKEGRCYNKTTNKKISACIPMHTFGHPCRIDKIAEICKQYNIPLVEDAAESLGSFYKGKHTGTFGNIGVLSFNGNKTITTGGGGMLLFNDLMLAKKAKHLTTQAKISHAWEFVHDEIGYNYRMPNINAALGLAQLENIEQFINIQRNIAAKYESFFSTSDIHFFKEPVDAKSNYWLNVLILKDRLSRDEFLKYTNDRKVMTRPVWELMSRLAMFKNCQQDNLINAKSLADRIVNIPSSIVL